MKKTTKLEQIKHFFGLIWLVMKLVWETLRNKWVWIGIAFITWTWIIAWFNSNYEIKTSFKFGVYQRGTVKKLTVAPTVVAQVVKPTSTPLTEEQIVKQAKNGDILWNIYMLESTRGKNDGCRLKGEGFAGFGVMDGKTVVCYPTFEKAVERAAYWFDKLEPEVNLINALCSWNLGKLPRGKHMNCHYYQSYMSL